MQKIIITNFKLPKKTLENYQLVERKKELYCFRAKKENHKEQDKNLIKQYKEGGFVGVKSTDFTPEALFLDMDGTTIHEESLVTLSEHLGLEKKINQMTEDAMQGKTSFNASFLQRLELLKGVEIQTIKNLAPKFRLHHGIKELCFWCQTKKIPVFLVSGGLSFFCEYIAKIIVAEDWHANHPDISEHKLTGQITSKIVDREEKKTWFYKICQEKGLNPKNSIMIGDGANDKEILEASGLAVGFQPKKVLYNTIDVYNGTSSHKVLINFLEISL